MDDPDPVVTEKDVPSYDVVEQKIKELDNTIIVYRIYYFFNMFIFRFQLIKKDKMCIIEIPRTLLENIGKNGSDSEKELSKMIELNVESSECWAEFKA